MSNLNFRRLGLGLGLPLLVTTKFVCTSEAPSGCIIAVSIDEAMMA